LAAIIFCQFEDKKGYCTLLYGVGEESIFSDGSDNHFIEYCEHGPITCLARGGKKYIQQTRKHKSVNPDNFTYCNEPLIQATRELTLGFKKRLKLLMSHLQILMQFQRSIVSLPSVSLLGEDFAYLGIMRELVKESRIDSVVITTSNYLSQPLWMRNLKSIELHMIHYSQNWKPIFYKEDNVNSDVPNLRLMQADIHWVWTHAFAKYVADLCIKSTIKVIGPILWRMPKVINKTSSALQIAVFDVPSISKDAMINYGEITNYFKYENTVKFIQDIILMKKKLKDLLKTEVQIVLKTKRAYVKSAYDYGYYRLIEELGKTGVIKLLPPEADIFRIVSESDLIISYPFTSTNYVADFLKKKSFYYDPTGLIVHHDFSDSQTLIEFINNPEHLFSMTIKFLNSLVKDKSTIDIKRVF
jgi:polysaccharide biosynthesis PFTS motif protein